MEAELDTTSEVNTLVVEVFPREVDALADITLRASVTCDPERDLRGRVLLIEDGGGAPAGQVAFTEFDGETSRTDPLVLTAPLEVGEHVWTAVLLPADADEDSPLRQMSAAFAFTVKPHATRVLVWDVPSAVPAGETFRIKVGIKCSGACAMAGVMLGLYDHNGVQVGAAAMSDDIWPRSSNLHHAEVELEAPAVEGQHRWEARFVVGDSEIPHADGSVAFGVRVVPAPEWVVTIEAVDAERKDPIKGLHVLLHPYRVFTDEHGVARIGVPKGEYTAHVTGFRYVPFKTTIEVAGDLTIKVELSVEPPADDD